MRLTRFIVSFVCFLIGIGVGALIFFGRLYRFLEQTDYTLEEESLKPHFGEETSIRIDEQSKSIDENENNNEELKADMLIDEALGNVLNPRHGAANNEDYKKRLEIVCRAYKEHCQKIQLQGDYSDQERFLYTVIPVFLIAKLDRYLDDHPEIVKTLSQITINKENGRRGYATSRSIQLNVGSMKSYREYMEIAIHELGHIVDLGVIEGNAPQLHQQYTEFGRPTFSVDDPSINHYETTRQSEKIRRRNAKKKDFCSGYGQTNTIEDSAECFNLYLMHNALFRYFANRSDLMKKKYNFRAQQFGGKYLFESSNDLFLVQQNPDAFFFDTTKISVR